MRDGEAWNKLEQPEMLLPWGDKYKYYKALKLTPLSKLTLKKLDLANKMKKGSTCTLDNLSHLLNWRIRHREKMLRLPLFIFFLPLVCVHEPYTQANNRN